MNVKLVAQILLVWAGLSQLTDASTMESPSSVTGHTIEVPAAYFFPFRERILPADQYLLLTHDELVLALTNMVAAKDAPDWIKVEGLYTLTLNEASTVFLLDFPADIALAKLTEFNRRLALAYLRIKIDGENDAIEAFMKEIEALRKRVDAEKNPLRLMLLEKILGEKIRIMRETPMG
jgi:hypothetical protein